MTSMRKPGRGATRPPTSDEPAPRADVPRVLIIAPDHPLMRAIQSDIGTGFTAGSLQDLDAEHLRRSRAEVVLAPLSLGTHDILDIAERLRGLKFRGALKAVTGPLPDPETVASEVGAACNGFRFELIVLGEDDARP